MADFTLSLDAEAAVQLATAALKRHQLRVVRNFDLRDALQSQDSSCTCPHHGTENCACNYVVLLAYDGGNPGQVAQPAAKIVIHSYDGTTWLSISAGDEGSEPAEDLLADPRLLRALAEVMYEAAP